MAPFCAALLVAARQAPPLNQLLIFFNDGAGSVLFLKSASAALRIFREDKGEAPGREVRALTLNWTCFAPICEQESE